MLKKNYYIEPTAVDQLVFERLVPSDHYLRQVKASIDFEQFRALVRDCYSPNMGRGAEDPVRMIKLEFLELHYRLSDREVIAEAQVNVAFRFFLDLSLESPLPVPSLLAQFRGRLKEERHRALLNEVVAQARAQGLVQDRLRLKDATHIVANIAVPTTLQLVAQVRTRLLQALRPYALTRVEEEEAEVETIRLATSDLKDEERLIGRVLHLQQIVQWADALQAQLGEAGRHPPRRRRRLDQALAQAHKLLDDADHPDQGDRLGSVVDPDARWGKHGEYYSGYLGDISMDEASELITAGEVLPANGDEAADARRLLESEEAAHGNDVQAISLDGAGFRGDILRELRDPAGIATTVYVPVRDWPREGEGLFASAAFTLDPSATVLTCPAGQQSQARYRNEADTSWVFTFRRALCAACARQGECLARLPKKHGRTVHKNDYEAEYAAARALAQTAAYEAVRAVHRKIERKLAEMVRYHGGRRARYRGRWRVQVQWLLTALVVNIKRMVRLLRTARQRPVLAATPG